MSESPERELDPRISRMIAGVTGVADRAVQAARGVGGDILRTMLVIAKARHDVESSKLSRPFYAWEAIRIARQLGEDPPSWAMDHIYAAADRIHALIDDPDSDLTAAKLAEAAGLARAGGRRGPATRLRDDQAHLRAAYAVAALIREGVPPDRAKWQVGVEHGMGKRTVETAWQNFRKFTLGVSQLPREEDSD